MTLCIVVMFLLSGADTTMLFSDAVRYLSGASDLETIPQEDAEKYEHLSRNPLKINSCGRAELLESGLFSSYQVETVLDYRKRCGPICSAGELSVVDGFDERIAACLSCFVDFEPNMVKDRRFHGEFSAFTAMKIASGKGNAQWMCRAKASYGGIAASFASKSDWTWPMSLPKIFGCSASYSSDAICLSSAVAGYFNARFGQGLCLWTGMVMENYSTPSALMRRPGGIAPYTSSSVEYAMRGAALSFVFNSFSANVLYDCSGHRAGAHAAWNHAHGQVGVTAWAAALPEMWKAGAHYSDQWCMSVDFQQMIGRFTLYGETTIQQSMLGARVVFANVDLGLRAFYSKEEHSMALAASWQSKTRMHMIDFGSTLDAFPYGKGKTPARGIQLKTLTTYTFAVNESWSAVTRLSSRTRNWTDPYRFDLRQDIRWKKGNWGASARLNGLYCQSFSCLGYLEGVYKGRFEVWLQSGVFFVDNWEDRIFVYQKDAPQSFNVPAMYGRGYWVSVYSSVRLWKRLDVYFRGTWEDYPWARETDTRKRPSLSLKVQLVVIL